MQRNPRNHKIALPFSSTSIGTEYNAYKEGDAGGGSDTNKIIPTDKKELAENRRQAFKLLLDYYHNHQQFPMELINIGC